MKTLSKTLSMLLLPSMIIACAPVQHPYYSYSEPEPVAQHELATEVYYYPVRGQSIERQDRDRFECYRWAKQQTGFDPSQPYLAPHQRTYVVPDPAPGHDTAAGAFTGAILGAMIGAPHNTGEGAVIGAIAGGTLGAASDAARQEQAGYIQEQYARRAMNRHATLERQADNYRRAMKACFEGRGYSVR